MNLGYILLHRKLKQSSFYGDSEYVHLWIHLLLSVNHSNSKIKVGHQMVELKPGQFLTSRDSLAKHTKINSSKIERILKVFEIEHQIEQQSFTKYRIITVTNWDEHQKMNSKIDSKRTTNEQQVNTNKECIKNEKNKNPCDDDFEKFWSMYPRKIGRGYALKIWKRISPSKELTAMIFRAVDIQKQSDQWTQQHGKYIPHPSTWLNQGRWDDVIEVEDNSWKIT